MDACAITRPKGHTYRDRRAMPSEKQILKVGDADVSMRISAHSLLTIDGTKRLRGPCLFGCDLDVFGACAMSFQISACARLKSKIHLVVLCDQIYCRKAIYVPSPPVESAMFRSNHTEDLSPS